MKKSSRHKLIRISLIFLIYSVIVVKSDKKNEEAVEKVEEKKPEGGDIIVEKLQAKKTEENPKQEVKNVKSEPEKTVENKEKVPISQEDKKEEKPQPAPNSTDAKPKVEVVEVVSVVVPVQIDTPKKELAPTKSAPEKAGDKKDAEKKPETKSEGHNSTAGLETTVIPKEINATKTKNNCTPAAIRQFPRPLMPPNARKHGGLVIHVLVAIYMFIGLAVVCDEYFVASLDRICEELKMSPDVAGATFMAAGSSAPELATVIIGVFYAEDDIGISGVIGSAVFNIMFVISVCALATSAIVTLNWWPLIRDSTFYALSICIMLIVMKHDDHHVNWIGSVVMLLFYVIYCVVLYFNTPLEKWAHTLPIPFNQTIKPANEQSGLVGYQNLDEEGKYVTYGNVQPMVEQQTVKKEDDYNWNPGQDWSPERSEPAGPIGTSELRGAELNQEPVAAASAPAQQPPPQQPDYYKPKEFDPSTKVNPLLKPEDGANIWVKTKWVILFPIHFFCIYTMPDCRTEKYKNWYPFTFFISMAWISFYSYFMVWMITIIGYTLAIPDNVMGLTFVAAGVSVPDALSSIAVIKEGYGDMAVSNAIGSNVFDILVCLGLPWFLKTAIFSPGERVKVISEGLIYSTLSLLSTVAFLVVAVHYNGWKLDRKLGIVLMIWYILFITFASVVEWRKADECITDY